MNKERDYFFDNLKAVLIFLVVLGHFLLPIRIMAQLSRQKFDIFIMN